MIDIKSLKKTLEDKIGKCDKVVIIPHNNADFDAIGSAIGLSLICRELNKPATIIVNDPPHIIEPGVKQIITECNKEFEILKKDKYLKHKEDNELFILTDVNKRKLICVDDCLPDPDNIIIIDHHNSDSNTVQTKNTFIDASKSSASEILTEVLQEMNIAIPSNVANYLYAGIYLDTAKLTKNCKSSTMHLAGDLLSVGADINKVNEFFKIELESYRRVQNLLINNIKINSCLIALIKANEDEEYTIEELAKTADDALKFGADASFAIGRVEDNLVYISGRSSSKVYIGKIMEKVAPTGLGGGHQYMGAARLYDKTIDEAYSILVKELKPYYYCK